MNVQQGDLAIIVSGPQSGLIVQVESFAGWLEESVDDGPHWGVRSPKEVMCYSPQLQVFGPSNRFVIPDRRLRPIAGDRFAKDLTDLLDSPTEAMH